MPERAIADSSYLVALFDTGDVFHAKAKSLASGSEDDAVFLDCVMNEVYSVLGRRAEEKKRSKEIPLIYDKIQDLVPARLLVWTYRDVSDRYGEIMTMMKEHQGRLNFHDCLIAVSARTLGISRIVSFDPDFDKVLWLSRVSG